MTQSSARMLAGSLSAAVALLLTVGTASAEDVTVFGSPKQTCKDLTGSTTSVMLANSSKNAGVQCAYTAESGRIEINAGKTKNWQSSSPSGYSGTWYGHGDDSEKNMTYANSYAGLMASGYAWNVQPTNFGTKDKHFSGCVLWSTAENQGTKIQSSQYIESCNGDQGVLNVAKLYPVSMSMVGPNSGKVGIPASYRIAVNGSAYEGPSNATGTAALMIMRGSAPDAVNDTPLGQVSLSKGGGTISTLFGTTTGALPPGSYQIYGAYLGTSSATPVIPSAGWFKMATSPITVVVSAPMPPSSAPLVSATRVSVAGSAASATPSASSTYSPAVPMASLSATGAGRPFGQPSATPLPYTGPMGSSLVQAGTTKGGRISIGCPSGGVPTQINLLSSVGDVDIEQVHVNSSGAGEAWVQAPKGADTKIQEICRLVSAPLATLGKLTYGSAQADRIDLTATKGSAYAGLGRDIIVITGKGSVADGGLGSDRITVSSKDGVGDGGFGDDKVRSTSSARSLIIGGAGKDTLFGGPGATLINARDGQGGDIVWCASAKNIVFSDKGDILHGPCRRK